MNQSTHAWIAVRAIALLDDAKEVPKLVKVLEPHATRAAIGAWIPDKQDAKRGGSKTENHVLKIKPYDKAKADASRFVTTEAELLKRLGPGRAAGGFIKDSLPTDWWTAPYRGDVVKPGQHVANRAMALTVTAADLLLLGNPELDALVPGSVAFADKLTPEARTTADQAALHLLMLSHFVADACMPCHCDARPLAAYDNGLHKPMEAAWAKIVGPAFPEKAMVAMPDDPSAGAQVLAKARSVDAKLELEFGPSVPEPVDNDVWNEVINLCRASFAIASIIVPPGKFPYGGKKTTTYAAVFGSKPDDEAEFHRAILHDAVLNVAMVWKHVWTSVTPAKQRKPGPVAAGG